jgi:hypothetical protein
MQLSFRALVSVSATLALILSLASPAAASSFGRDEGDIEASVPVVVDLLLLRPLGLAMTITGAVVYGVAVLPITAITRPTELGKPLGPLVAAPARYTFSDPLGQHP